MNPDPMLDGFKASVEALRWDAQIWRSEAEVIGTIPQMLDGLELTWVEAGVFFPIKPAYNELIAKMTDRTRMAQEAMTAIGESLDHVAAYYQIEDDEAAARYLEMRKDSPR